MSASQFNRAIDFVRDAAAVASAMWWRFFDWLAVVEWKKLWQTAVVVLMLGALLHGFDAALSFVLISVGVKVLAGGKRRAEIVATQAVAKADVEAMERRVVEAQMSALQAQIEPHFLFNTLALIGQLIETDPPAAAKVHQHLIDYLRATLPQMRAKDGGTLGKQVQLSRAYLAIMQARMKERLSVSFDVAPHLESLPFPPMMLQTLIENSIKHGLEPKIAGGHIAVAASIHGATLHVDVTDDGVGFNMHAGEGVGLANIRERLKLLYDGRAQLVIEAPVTGGAYTSIRIPLSPPEKKA
ncbi:sensor histidine kinase [Massilia sp. TS11]|uniref:sensor histidine kinase n=1 Tax=Massilia sp. TS11 TaxID=2908003 RepID=UPI001EDB3131|nr:histidine kinase [Massilia sp. TS11]MCG2586056.1 histidine kinase [Massilia sp. TS11]